MVEIRNKLNDIKEYLKEAIEYTQGSIQVFQGLKRKSFNKDEDYDFEDFKELDVFEKAEQENIEKDKTMDCHLNFIKMNAHLGETIKILDTNRTRVYEKFLADMKSMSDEIHAATSVSMFLKHWDEKVVNNYELREYPSKFLKCLEKIPNPYQEKLAGVMTTIKRLPGYDKNFLNVLNESDGLNQRNSDVISPYQSKNFMETKYASLGDNTFFNENMLKKIEQKGKICQRGNTLKLGLSVLDYTIDANNCSSPLPRYPKTVMENNYNLSSSNNDESFNAKDVPDLNASIISNDVLNQAIHDIDDTEDVEPISEKNYEIYSFIESSNPEVEDDTSYPEIEKATNQDYGFNSFNLTFDQSVNISHLGGSIQLKIDDSIKMDDDDSISYMNESKSKRFNENDLSVVDISACDFGYSFNKSVRKQHSDDEDA